MERIAELSWHENVVDFDGKDKFGYSVVEILELRSESLLNVATQSNNTENIQYFVKCPAAPLKQGQVIIIEKLTPKNIQLSRMKKINTTLAS